ncbi:MAG TPA: hypothetical protein VK666_22990 [Chryseolinea sp.]|nr:hypothetical protein [Chryseolinea sp.]
MSKKKNTLKDLDEFLKQQAATLVEPTPLRESIAESSTTETSSAATISEVNVREALLALASKEDVALRSILCSLIVDTIGSQPSTSPEDKMLINTALYLKSGHQWKEAIRKYWKEK